MSSLPMRRGDIPFAYRILTKAFFTKERLEKNSHFHSGSSDRGRGVDQGRGPHFPFLNAPARPCRLIALKVSHDEGELRVTYAAFQIALLVLLLSGAFVFYFLPSLFAYWMGRKNAAAIFVVNFLLGITAVGWIFALIWAFTGKRRIEAAEETEGNVTQRLRELVEDVREKA